MSDIEIKSTKGSVEDFKESILWDDFKNELESWKEGFRAELESIVSNAEVENPSTASVLLHMGDINGRIKAVDYMLSIPDIFIQILEDKQDGDRSDET